MILLSPHQSLSVDPRKPGCCSMTEDVTIITVTLESLGVLRLSGPQDSKAHWSKSSRLDPLTALTCIKKFHYSPKKKYIGAALVTQGT